jgi:acyl-CoA thioester hydrolase
MPASPAAPTPSPPRSAPVSGSVRLRVRYCECDPMGVVHHAAYIPWLEMGRTELLRDAGVSYAQLEASGVFLVIIRLEAAFKRPAFYDDVLEVRTRVVGGSRVKILHEYQIVRAEAGATNGRPAPVGELLLTGSSALACVDRSGRPTMLPEWLIGQRAQAGAAPPG